MVKQPNCITQVKDNPQNAETLTTKYSYCKLDDAWHDALKAPSAIIC